MKTVKNYIKAPLAMMVFATSFISGVEDVRADILITPTMIVFEDRDRFSHVTLANTKDDASIYEMTWLRNVMQEGTGAYSVGEKVAGAFDLSDHIVFAPRRVTLPTKGTQRIKLGLRRPAEVPAGDYHAHLRFAALPAEEQPGYVPLAKDQAAANVSVTVSYSIPIILRAGEVDDGASIGQINLGRDPASGALMVNVPVTRKVGPYGTLGHLYVYNVNGGAEELVGEISNANIFPEISQRIFGVKLKKEVTSGQLKVSYRYFDRESDRVYDEKTFPLN